MRFPSRVVVAWAFSVAFVVSGCSATAADTPAMSGGSTGTPLAGSAGTTAGAGTSSSSGGSLSSTGGAGQAAAGGPAGGTATSSGGTIEGGGGQNTQLAGAGAGGQDATAGTGGSSGGAAGGGAAGDGAAGGTGAYNPCPTDGMPCKILPFGDSITRGAKSSDDAGYRSALFKLIVAAKQKATFTGSLSNGPTQVSGQTFPRMHEGHPGWTIDPGYNMISSSYSGISSLVPSPALNGKPHIILLMIGTNDLFARDTANMASRLEVFLDDLVKNAPNALIVLAQITPLGNANAALTAYNAKIPGIIQSHAAKGHHLIGVDMSKLPTSQLADGTHPNDQGYAYMANVWYAAIKDVLPKQ